MFSWSLFQGYDRLASLPHVLAWEMALDSNVAPDSFPLREHNAAMDVPASIAPGWWLQTGQVRSGGCVEQLLRSTWMCLCNHCCTSTCRFLELVQLFKPLQSGFSWTYSSSSKASGWLAAVSAMGAEPGLSPECSVSSLLVGFVLICLLLCSTKETASLSALKGQSRLSPPCRRFWSRVLPSVLKHSCAAVPRVRSRCSCPCLKG